MNRIQPRGFFKLFVTARLDKKLAAASGGGQAFVLPTDKWQSVRAIDICYSVYSKDVSLVVHIGTAINLSLHECPW